MALFVSSFLVLFLETALIRWMPAYVRLLAYFSNFILLASFLGIGVGCLLATRRSQPVRLVPADPVRGDPRGRSCCGSRSRCRARRRSISPAAPPTPVVPVESTLLLPLLFVVGRGAVRHGRAAHGARAVGPAAAARLRDQPARQPRRRRRVRAGLVARAAAERLVRRRRRARRCRSCVAGPPAGSPRVNVAAARRLAGDRAPHGSAAACGRRTTGSPSSRTTPTPSSR